MKNKKRGKAICVLGMHRSGTSAVARAINLLGVYLGEPDVLMPPNKADNPKGYWEHTGIVGIHERILSSLGRRWHDLWPMPEGWWAYPEILPLKEELSGVLRREFVGRPLWGWKDPRTCLMLPLWKEILREEDMEIGYLIVIRNPMDVATSLWKRDNLSLSESLLLWQLHTLSSLLNTSGFKRVILQYDSLMEGWRSSLKRIAMLLEIPWPSDEGYLTEEIGSFLEPGLRHSKSAFESLASNPKVPGFIVKTYGLCLKAEANSDFFNSKEFSDMIDVLYMDYASYSGAISSDLKEALREKNRLIQEKIGEIREREELIQEIIKQKDEQIREKDEQISSILNTWSWRVTAPMRLLGRLLSKTYNYGKDK